MLLISGVLLGLDTTFILRLFWVLPKSRTDCINLYASSSSFSVYSAKSFFRRISDREYLRGITVPSSVSSSKEPDSSLSSPKEVTISVAVSKSMPFRVMKSSQKAWKASSYVRKSLGFVTSVDRPAQYTSLRFEIFM